MNEQSAQPALPGLPEMWAGIECTINRVGDRYFNQLEWNGHMDRLEDLDRIAALGVRTLRYPLLWEQVAPRGVENADWTWADERMHRLRELGIRPIVGLLHHGSGPQYTSLLDPRFPEKLAEYARAVAQRFPWVDAYTPVNEPLTTARFSGLYGYWYPHGHSELELARALLNQIRGIKLSMRAIRQVNPCAALAQTEDLGQTHSTPLLRYQADYENLRRWLSLDLLAGRVDRQHPLYDYFDWAGISERELFAALEDPLPPDLIGINHYITSERYLDERLERYPVITHGGNGRHAYADVEAVRVCVEGPCGPASLIKAAWQRYGLPVALTEVHLGATREEQLRWLVEVWQASVRLRRQGVDLRAVTAWSLFGAYNWNSLVTRDDGYYEPGAFDIRSIPPRSTALADAIRTLASGRSYRHPVLNGPGWWRRPGRLLYPPVTRQGKDAPAGRAAPRRARAARPLLITGAAGTLGQAFERLCALRGLAFRSLTRRQLDITDPIAVQQILDEIRPWAIVNAAGFVRVDDAEREPALCRRINVDGPLALAAACDRLGIPLLTYSSDLVFDGSQQVPYLEMDLPAPLNVYGATKAEMETAVLACLPAALVIRTSAFFGPWDRYNFPAAVLATLSNSSPFLAASDTYVSPAYVPDLVHASLDLLLDGETGLWHLVNDGVLSWYDFARAVASAAGVDGAGIQPRRMVDLHLPARRPLYSALGSQRGMLLPSFETALARFIEQTAR